MPASDAMKEIVLDTFDLDANEAHDCAQFVIDAAWTPYRDDTPPKPGRYLCCVEYDGAKRSIRELTFKDDGHWHGNFIAFAKAITHYAATEHLAPTIRQRSE